VGCNRPSGRALTGSPGASAPTSDRRRQAVTHTVTGTTLISAATPGPVTTTTMITETTVPSSAAILAGAVMTRTDGWGGAGPDPARRHGRRTDVCYGHEPGRGRVSGAGIVTTTTGVSGATLSTAVFAVGTVTTTEVQGATHP
jgi:hypothetical protein